MNERSRLDALEAAADQIDGRSTPKPRHLIGATVEFHLDRVLWQLVRGEIGLQDLTPALAAFYHFGHADGIASVQPALERARADADRYYAHWTNPGRKLARTRRSAMDAAAAEHWQGFLEGGDL